MNLTNSSRFFLVFPLDLEDLGALELQEKMHLFYPDEAYSITNRVPGGLEIECAQSVGFSLNKILRTPTRILLRLSEFKSRDFPKLYQKISKFNWAPYLIGQTPDVVCASKNSRLFDSRKIEKAIQDGVAQFYRHKPVKKKYLDHLGKTNKENLPKIYFRIIDDLCTLSLDTTGERLHLRGEKTLTGLAPIRESLAGLLLIELRRHIKNDSVTLIDPMCGSGTFLIEAMNTYAVTESRDFSYLHMPLVIDAAGSLKALSSLENLFFKKLVGLEINPEIVALAKKNAPEIDFECADVFSDKPYSNSSSVVITNPPYGIRVGENINLDYFYKLITSIKNRFNPELLGIIIPKDYKLKESTEFKMLTVRPFSNGGIDVVFYVLGMK